MGYFESDALEMLEVYLLETRQLNGQLSEILLEAERAGRFNESSIHSIFRVMHTIKSSSAMMDINGLSSLAHKLEDLFSYYRENMDKLEHPEPDLFDLLFAASDFIAQELEQMNREDYAPGDTSVLEQMTDDFLGHVSREEEKDSGKGGKTQGEEEGKEELPVIPELFVSKSGTVVNVTLEEGCRMENIRAFMLVRSITGLCTLVETYPENLEKQGESAQYIEGHGVFIRFESGDKEKVLETLRKGLFVAQCRVLADSQPQDTAAAAQKAAPERENTDSREGEFMEVRTERLDYLQNLASELLLQMQVLENELKRNGMEDLESGLGHQISLLVGQIERSVMEMRLVPVSRIVPKLKRALRDICRDQKKEADLVVRCSDVEADKSVVDYVSEALLHILRNAVDHGIESPEERLAAGKDRRGKITFSADNVAGELRMTISDDGKGIDEERVRERARQKGLFASADEEYDPQKIREFILYPGFSTNEKVTEYSGRGVGLDVVKNIMEDVGGNLSIRSTIGQGSAFSISVPLNLASIECVCFRVGQYRFSIPARHVYHFLEYESFRGQIREINGRDYILYEDRMMPLINLRRFYSLGGEIPERAILVYVKGAEKEGCFFIDSIYEQKRIVVKNLPALLGTGFRSRTGICGCSIMGSGRICAALDTEIIISRYEKEGRYGG
ncbi:chemotaxis protein CheA [Enterocloster bolteae]|uniref:chemotaxis protein CheA n=1 Tax=Enterocloster bolteae TaxID=208479 RepID=UPI0025A1183C|nr:chemotaxis protein CheA [Enterocloster bolteae]